MKRIPSISKVGLCQSLRETSCAPLPHLFPFFSLHGLIQLFGELQQSVGILLVIHFTCISCDGLSVVSSSGIRLPWEKNLRCQPFQWEEDYE